MQVQLPLQIGTRVDCRWRDGEYYTARVVERRLVEGSELHEYYVHYLKCALPFVVYLLCLHELAVTCSNNMMACMQLLQLLCPASKHT